MAPQKRAKTILLVASLSLALSAFAQVSRQERPEGSGAKAEVQPRNQNTTIAATVAGTVFDSDEDGLGDELDSLPGSPPLPLIAARLGRPAFGFVEEGTSNDTSPGEPNLISAAVRNDGTNLNLSIRYEEGTYNRQATFTRIALDTDQYPRTGNQGLDRTQCKIDSGFIGVELLIEIHDSFGSEAVISEYQGMCGTFDQIGSGNASFLTNGVNAVIPLTLIQGSDDGFNFKILAVTPDPIPPNTQPPPLDIMPNLSQPASQSNILTQGEGRIQLEWDVSALQGTDFGTALVTLTTKRGLPDELDTSFFAGSQNQDGLLTTADFHAPVQPKRIGVMTVPKSMGIGEEGVFLLDVSGALRSALKQGFDFFSIQGRVDESQPGSGFRQGLQIRSATAENIAAGKAPLLQLTPPALADLSIQAEDGPDVAMPGQTVTYEIRVGNAGPSEVTGAAVDDDFPPQLRDVTWSCSSSAGATCPASDGTGAIHETVDIPTGESLAYRAAGLVEASASGVLVNRASVAAPPDILDTDDSNNSDRVSSFIGPFNVNSTLDLPDTLPGDGVCSSGNQSGQAECTLRAAVQEANALLFLPQPQRDQLKILLLPGCYPLTLEGPSEDDAATGDLDITGSLVIEGGFANQPLSCDSGELVRGALIDGLGQDRVFDVAFGAEAQLLRLTVRNGDSGEETGGGIRNQGSLTLAESTVTGNQAAAGGGIVNIGTMTLTNVTISGNQGGTGAGILSSTVTTPLILKNSTVLDNQSERGAGGIVGRAEITNSIMAANLGGDCEGEIVSQGGNLDSDGSCRLLGGDLPSTDPQLGPLQDNDGPTPTHALSPGSPAIDSANGANCPSTDQRGALRPPDGSGMLCDIGAYEAPPFQDGSASREVPAAADFDNPLKAFIMIGNPLSRPPAPLMAFTDAFGPPRPDRWRLFRWDSEQGNIDFLSDPNFDFSSGPGYWLITQDGGRLTVDAQPNDASGPLDPIILQPGFQLISTPVNFPIRWSGCMACFPPSGEGQEPACRSRLPEGVSPVLWGFDGRGAVADPGDEDAPDQARGYFLSCLMEPLHGYFVFNGSGAPTSLAISPLCAALPSDCGTGSVLSLAQPSSAAGWRATLSASAGDLADSQNYLGEDSAGLDGPDSLDLPEPPPFLGLSLYFRHPEWNPAWPLFASDIRALPATLLDGGIASHPPRPGRRQWDFEVWTSAPQTWIRLEWRIQGDQAAALTLRDLDGNRTLRMPQAGSYTYFSGSGGVRRFRIFAE